MSIAAPRQTEFASATGTFQLNVSDFESVNIIVVGSATATVTAGIFDGTTFRPVTQSITNGTSFDVKGFSHLNLVIAGTVNSTNKIIVYGNINKIDRV